MSLTFLTPVAPEHAAHLPQCQASVAAQSVRCEHLWAWDAEHEGPGAIRNRLLAKVTTEYVSFLDADDWLEPHYAETMLAAIRPGWYAYCDHYEDGIHHHVPAIPWCVGAFHVVTAVVPTALARYVGGFDESLPALEDTALFLNLMAHNVCGIHVREPLMHYRKGGGRGQSARDTGIERIIKNELHKTYGGIKMGCCGDMTIQQGPIGVKQDGDVLAQALWGGNREEHGRATGRRYPRLSFPKTTYVAPADINAAPHLWREVRDPEPVDQLAALSVGEGARAIVDEMSARGVYQPAPFVPPPPIATDPKPNIERVKRLGRKAKGNE